MNANAAEVRKALSDYLNRVSQEGERIVIERRGKPVAAIVAIEDLALIEQKEDEADIKAAKRIRKEKGGITLAQYRKKHGI